MTSQKPGTYAAVRRGLQRVQGDNRKLGVRSCLTSSRSLGTWMDFSHIRTVDRRGEDAKRAVAGLPRLTAAASLYQTEKKRCAALSSQY
jgi:hypothetical protein